MRLVGRLLLAIAGAVALAGCQQSPPEGFAEAPSPALWEIRANGAVRGWLFGTIHSLPDGVEWRSETLSRALARSDILVVEVADLDNPQGRADSFAALAISGEQPLLKDRIAQSERPDLLALMERGGFQQGHFHRTETWAAALTLAQIGREGDSANGVDRALAVEYAPGRLIELEGAARQLAIFDRLPEAEQRDLLSGIVQEAQRSQQQPGRLARIWFAGDMQAIRQEQERGILADPEIRGALLTSRNRDWTARIVPLLENDDKPFVAVGAAHLPGPDGLAAMLRQRGYTVARIQ